MRKWLTFASLVLAVGACDARRDVAAPDRAQSLLGILGGGSGLLDPALSAALATALPTDNLVVIVNYDENAVTRDAVTSAILSTGAGAIQFKHLALVAALATPSQITQIAALSGIRSIYLNRQLLYYGVPFSGLGITGKGVGIAILDSGIDGLYNPDVHYPDKTIQNIKILFNLRDLFTFQGSINRTIKQGADLFVTGLPNSETSIGHGTHVSGIAAGLGAASGGYYTGVAPGAKLIGIGAGDVLFIFWALAGFDYILDHQQDYNIQVVNNSWGTSGAFDPNDPINKASKTVHDHGITVVFAAGNDSPEPTNSAIHCGDPTGQNRPPWLADFSSRGIAGDPLYHPDITAPGVHVVSTRASTGFVLNVSDAPHDFDLTSTCAISLSNLPYYTCASGTSMATPHVVGVVALLQEAAGGHLTPDQVLAAITQTARPLPGFGTWEVGAGYLDAYAAVIAVRP